MDKFILDKCSVCGKYKALKNGICAECDNKKFKMPEFLKDVFKIKEQK
jgi:uncharacterized OB-fold protein